MVHTELRFVGVLERLDKLMEEIEDLGGEYNSIQDGYAEFETHDIHNNLTEQAEKVMEEIDDEIDKVFISVDKIQAELAVNDDQFHIMKESAITNRWKIYAQMMGAENISIKDMFTGNH